MLNFFSALSFLTIIPAPRQTEWSDKAKVLHFPLVGLLIGALLYGLDYLLSMFAYREIRAALDVCQQANVVKVDLATEPADKK